MFSSEMLSSAVFNRQNNAFPTQSIHLTFSFQTVAFKVSNIYRISVWLIIVMEDQWYQHCLPKSQQYKIITFLFGKFFSRRKRASIGLVITEYPESIGCLGFLWKSNYINAFCKQRAAIKKKIKQAWRRSFILHVDCKDFLSAVRYDFCLKTNERIDLPPTLHNKG